MPRVLSLSTLYPNAHQPRFGAFVARQLEALAALPGWQISVINPIGTPPLAPGRYRPLAQAAVGGIEGGVEVHRPRFGLIPVLGGPLNPWAIARAALPLARRLHGQAPFDLIDAQFFYPDGPAAAAIARTLRLPLSIKARGADISYWGARWLARRQMLAAGAQASGLLAVSEALAGDMAAIGLPRATISIHHTGLDRRIFYPRPRAECRAALARAFALDLASGESLLCCVGALIARKGQKLVIEALGRLPDCRLALIGTGPDQAQLAARARSLGLGERVHFLGSLDHPDLALVLGAADAMVLPSASEGLANAWIEALACGVPIVISEAGGAREVLDGRVPQAGRIVPREAGAIAAAVQDLLARPAPREQVALSAARFSWQANAEALAAHYQRLLQA